MYTYSLEAAILLIRSGYWMGSIERGEIVPIAVFPRLRENAPRADSRSQVSLLAVKKVVKFLHRSRAFATKNPPHCSYVMIGDVFFPWKPRVFWLDLQLLSVLYGS